MALSMIIALGVLLLVEINQKNHYPLIFDFAEAKGCCTNRHTFASYPGVDACQANVM
jgi:hypothetical protein